MADASTEAASESVKKLEEWKIDKAHGASGVLGEKVTKAIDTIITMHSIITNIFVKYVEIAS